MSALKKRGLGRGLDALLSSGSPVTQGADGSGDELRELPLDRLAPGQHQPRRQFDDEALNSLADSIRAQGVVQPIVVRPAGADRYEIIAGERRWRAAKMAGLTQIPAVIRTLDERGAMAVALVENIQRSDLNPLEEAQALHRLIDECGLTHEACAEAVGKSRTAVSNLLRLMELNADVQDLVREHRLSFGHAKVLLGVQGARQSSLANMVAEQHLSVRQTEALVQAQPQQQKPKAAPPPAIGEIEKEIAGRIGLAVKLQQNDKGRGKLTVAFKSNGELQKLLGLLR
ncbi:ParB/RepB/Spo0J family partition protein [Solimonas sp. K1W22B-7]|uniref:ParB/RepB/Spo0J family partition protein n=1 Tax=Solimonas sp. K1W22B-7 TaxID=2303331 RepID=UPI000E33586A|nr:ParB/RepB/Spo0J family partition protein [Solimonas sp. K1W22B-7]AXQ27564.1 ParB/RepB/Spo0J family partition protein [Solimonas sp. K1W22B-7]